RLYAAGNYTEACPKFESSLRRYSGIGTRGKLAECYEKVGKTASAWALWSEVASFSHKNNEPEREAYAAEHAKNLEPQLAHLTLKLAAENTDSGVVIRRNGEVVDAAALGVAIAVDPGKISLEASSPGHVTWKQDIDVAAQGQLAIEIPALVEAPPEPPKVVNERGPEGTEHSNWQKPVGIAGVGIGAAVLVTGGIFGLMASSKWSSAFSEGCSHSSNVCTTQQGFDDSHSANSFATLSNVFVIGGLVVAGAGAVLWITAPKIHSDAPASATQASFGISPMPLYGGGAISLHGTL
ncbi:MAG: hypothetical protein ABI461_24165, partial [Polyangiaceae bacterium]